MAEEETKKNLDKLPDMDEKWEIPERFRAGMDTERHRALLAQNDEKQKEWKEMAGSAYATASASVRFRVKALETIDVLEPLFEKAKQGDLDDEFKIDDALRLRLAEAFAMLGRYDKAAEVVTDDGYRALYEKYWQAVTRDNTEWCGHAQAHQYVKDRIFSFTENREVEMLACNICGEWNAGGSVSAELKQRQSREDVVRQSTSKMSIGQSREWMDRNISKKR